MSSSAIAEARRLLAQNNVKEAAQKARSAFESLVQAGEADGLADAVRILVDVQTAPAEIAALGPVLEDVLERCRRRGDRLAEAHALLAIASLHNSTLEPDLALEAAERVRNLGDLGQIVEKGLSQVLTVAYLTKRETAKAAEAARKLLAAVQLEGNKESEAEAWQALGAALATSEEGSSEMLEASQKALALYRQIGHRAGQASALLEVSRAVLLLRLSKDGLASANESLNLFRELGQTKGMISALELIIQAHAIQNDPAVGLRIANHEFEAMRRMGDQRGQADLADLLAHQHAMLREPISGMHYARQALQLYGALGDLAGQAWSLHTLAEMQRMEGQMGEATMTCQQSLAAFKMLGSRRGQERASALLSALFLERGLPEKAPDRNKAVRALRDFSEAVRGGNVEKAKAVEEKLNSLRNLVTDEEIAGILGPLFQREDSADFLEKELGWQLPNRDKLPREAGDGDRPRGDLIKSFAHKTFYLANIFGGMNFGPQFRGVNPWRKGNPAEDGIENCWAMSSSVLPETDAWQQELQFRGGIMDSGLQVGMIFTF